MGVHGLWDLLSPVGRRVSVETLAGKRLAIDASIWMIQFMKAMRDEKGEMVRNAHLLGFFRRICKLLFLRTKPVFVFDGGTPALKRRTVIARRRQRENAQAKIRKTAEKMLLNHVKAMRLKMLAADIKDQTARNNSNVKEGVVDQSDVSRKNVVALEGHNQEAIDEMLVASILAEEYHSLYDNASSSAAAAGSDIDNISASATASQIRTQELGSSIVDLEKQNAKNNTKGKGVMVDQSDIFGKNGAPLEGHCQEMIDEMLVASILAEDSAGLDGNDSSSIAIGIDRDNASASDASFFAEYENEESDEEMILPVSDGNVDPAVLAALPPSMQLDLLVQMRERLMAENRQKYQKVKKAPQKFSELQIEAYLKTVAFRREIDEVQKAASGRGVGGVQTSRIASEANREFIFSSSFSGDKQLLTPNQADKNAEKLQKIARKDSPLKAGNAIASATKFNPGTEPNANNIETVGDFVNDVQTFLDERGRKRVSRRRAMGIRMTRDLERNIDLLKEFELERTTENNIETATITLDGRESILGKSHSGSQSVKDIDVLDVEILPSNSQNSLLEAEICNKELSQKSKSCLKISFDDDKENRSLDGDDELFARLVAGEPAGISSTGKSASDCKWQEGNIGKDCGTSSNEDRLEVNSSLAENGNNNESDLEWEEGIIGKDSSLMKQNKFETNFSYVEAGNNSSDVEWEEGTCLITGDERLEVEAFDVEDHQESEVGVKWSGGTNDFHEDASEFSANIPKTVSKGSVEEETALEEAIRRSLEDLTEGKDSKMFHLEKSGNKCKMLLQRGSCSPESSSKIGSALHNNKLSQSFVDVDGSNFEAGTGANASVSLIMHSKSNDSDGAFATAEPAVTQGTKENSQIGNLANNDCSVPTNIVGEVLTNSVQLALGNRETSAKEGAVICNSTEVSDVAMGQSGTVSEHTFLIDVGKSIAEENIAPIGVQQGGNDVEISMSKHEDNSSGFVGASLEDELSVLSQEYKNLGDEQKKLERNADSVNTEMFVECQELLQMFGLPYIIAPMEAEAQCAYMELVNLVDGVVTDDSDVFLFGARSVYKNIFDDRKYVETYFMKDIESELGLNREKLIRMAMLLGSDYTEGVSGIGIVNAIEVVNAFPEEDGLCKFREWIESPDPTILGKVGVQKGSSSKKKRSKASKGDKSDSKSNLAGTSTSDCEDNVATDDTKDIKQIFMEKHRNVSKNWHIPDSFPSDAVVYAYNSPQVDKSTEPFAWGKPDIFVLRRMCWEKFGWANQKADELLQPVLKEYNKHETQLRLEAFYTFNERFAKIRSRRIKQAVKGITGKQSMELAETDDLQKIPGATGKGKERKGYKKNTRKNSLTKGGNPMEPLPSEEGNKGLSSETDERRMNGAGGSKVRGKQRQKSIRRGRKMENPDSMDDETSSHDSGCSHDEYKNEARPEKVEFTDIVRRSKRARKPANYVERDEESGEPIDSLNASDHECSKEAAEQKLSHHSNVSRDDVADFSTERESTCQDSPPGDRLAGDCLVEGGGFCADEDQPETENDQEGLIQSEDTFMRSSDMDYLQSGGGFCVDKNDEDQDLQGQDGNTAAETTGNIATPNEGGETRHEMDKHESIISQASVSDTVQSSSKCRESDCKLSADNEHETRHQTPSNVVENIKDDSLSSVNAFSAIPYLKRKRRKT